MGLGFGLSEFFSFLYCHAQHHHQLRFPLLKKRRPPPLSS
jgi:hypothetical protein